MKVILQDQNQIIVRLDKGEEFLECFAKFMQEQNIKACAFSAIGACDSVELAYYNQHLKEYRSKPLLQEMEVLSLTGNGAMKEGQPFIHAHGVFGSNDFSVVGGHVMKLSVSPNLEILVTKLEGEMKREKDSASNLFLLS